MPTSITPFAKALYLCDGAIGFLNQKTDIMGLFNSIRPQQYPHVQSQFVVFAQLCGGLGQVPFFVNVSFAATGQIVHTTPARLLRFARRTQVVQLSATVYGIPFSQPGAYLVELFCCGICVADTTLELF